MDKILPNRFIVVDDDRSNNLICEYSLRRFSAIPEIKTYLDPELALHFIREAYADLQSDTPTMLLLDINMPILSGWDFLEIFKDLPDVVKQQFTIYILSSSIDQRDQERAITNPLVTGFLSKPLSTAIITKLFTFDFPQ